MRDGAWRKTQLESTAKQCYLSHMNSLTQKCANTVKNSAARINNSILITFDLLYYL